VTPHQRRVVEASIKHPGMTTREIAEMLGMKRQTVANARHKAYQSLGVTNLYSAAIALGFAPKVKG
jgi:DNA-binding NarL/FixJ family response regulator